MDSLTLQALGMALNHETSDELIRLRKEVVELRKFKKNVLRNNKKYLDDLQIFNGMLSEVHNSCPSSLDEMLLNGYGSWLSSYCVAGTKEEIENRVKYFWNREPQLFNHMNDDYENAHLESNHIHALMSNHFKFQDKDEEDYDYVLGQINGRKLYINGTDVDIIHNLGEFKTLDKNLIFYAEDVDTYETRPYNSKEDNELTMKPLLDFFQYRRIYWKTQDDIPNDSYFPRLYDRNTNEEFKIENGEELVKFYDTYKEAGQRKWKAYHQSDSYTELVNKMNNDRILTASFDYEIDSDDELDDEETEYIQVSQYMIQDYRLHYGSTQHTEREENAKFIAWKHQAMALFKTKFDDFKTSIEHRVVERHFGDLIHYDIPTEWQNGRGNLKWKKIDELGGKWRAYCIDEHMKELHDMGLSI
jgi:hypothetical protein